MAGRDYTLTLTKCAFLVVIVGAAAAAQEETRPTPPEIESFFVMTKADFDARIKGWTSYFIMHMDRKKVEDELSTSRPAGGIHISQCGPNAEAQQETAADFAPYADVCSYWAFLYASDDKAAEGDLFWRGCDNPFINHARRMREIVGATPIVAELRANVGQGKEQRSTSLQEVQWQFIAAAGCGYRGVLWPAAYRDVAWGDDLKRIEEQINRYGRFLAQAHPVDWVQVPKGQSVSALACEGYLFVFLLHPACMTYDGDGKTVSTPLDKTVCEGSVTIALPAGLTVRRGQTLGGRSLRLDSRDGKTAAQYGFSAGGEMLVFTLSGNAKAVATTRSTSRPTSSQPAVTENTR